MVLALVLACGEARFWICFCVLWGSVLYWILACCEVFFWLGFRPVVSCGFGLNFGVL